MPLRRHTIIFVTDSFSTTSGGRTASFFRRAKLFIEMGHEVVIATTSIRPAFPEIFDSLCKKHDIKNVKFENFYDFLCEGGLYPHQNDSNPDADQMIVEGISEAGEPLSRQLFDNDGHLLRSQILREYQHDDRAAAAELNKHRSSTIKLEQFQGKKLKRTPAAQSIYFEPTSQRPYFLVGPNEENGQGRRIWIKKNGEIRLFQNGREALAFWFAQLNQTYADALFFAEEHRNNLALLENPFDGKIRVVATVHSTFFTAPYTYGSEINGYLPVVLERLQDYEAVICITEQEQAHFSNYQGPRENVFHIPHPIPVPKMSECADREPLSIVVCTRYTHIKRVDHMIRAVHIASRTIPELKLHLFGSGDQEDELEQLIRELDASGNVFLHGHTDKPLEVLAHAELSLSTSLYEGLSLSILEALAMGTPVIAYDFLYGPRALIDNGKNGAIVKNGDIQALADKIVELLSSPNELELMRQHAKKLDPAFTLDSIRNQWERIFEYIDSCENDCLDKFSVVSGVDILDIENDENIKPSDFPLSLRVRTHGKTRATSYYLAFHGSTRIDIDDKLFLSGKLIDRSESNDTVMFSSNLDDKELGALLDDARELRLHVNFGRYSKSITVAQSET